MARLATIRWLAAALSLLGLSMVGLYFACPGTADWTPNIATDAFSIAVTILVVDRIVQRERERSIKPRLDRALYVIQRELAILGWKTRWDYISTRLNVPIPENLPGDVLGLLIRWREDFDTSDTRRPTADGVSLFLQEDVVGFVQRVQLVGNSERDILPSKLVVAIDSLDPIFSGQFLADLVRDIHERGAIGLDDWVLLTVILYAEEVARAFLAAPGTEPALVLGQPSAQTP
jgi:hypothetical protein